MDQGDHFSGISGNLEMSGNSAKSGKGRGICVVRKFDL